jgi:hypothetical protein
MGAIPRERSFELSGDHIVVVALDENDVVRWARLIFDPRSMRAEVGSTNAMHSEIYYRQKVDFIFQCPDDPGLARARFYRPVWNGGAATLELIGVVELH